MEERNLRKTRVGVVVSDKMDKTIVGAILLHGVLTDCKFALDGQLVHSQAQCLTSSCLIDICQLEQNAAGLHDCNPVLGRAFTGTHSGLSGLLSNRLIGEDLDPHLAATLDVTSHGNTSSLDLAMHKLPIKCKFVVREDSVKEDGTNEG